MTAEQFTYWLQGYAELNDAPPTAEQWQTIRDHLALVFNKVTPPRWPDQPAYRWPQSPTVAPPNTRPTVTCSLPGHTSALTTC